jgi:hypothetical protein
LNDDSFVGLLAYVLPRPVRIFLRRRQRQIIAVQLVIIAAFMSWNIWSQCSRVTP